MANPGIASLIDVVDHPGSRTLNGRPLVPSSEAVTGYNVPQRLVASAVWELPHGNPFRSWLRAANAMDPITSCRADRLCEGRQHEKQRCPHQWPLLVRYILLLEAPPRITPETQLRISSPVLE